VRILGTTRPRAGLAWKYEEVTAIEACGLEPFSTVDLRFDAVERS